jgi:hypothetical protein
MTQIREIGDLVCGERPNPIVYQFQDSTGAALVNLTGYSVAFVVMERDGTPLVVTDSRVQITDSAAAKVTYFWNGTEFATPGRYQAQFWVGNGIQRYASWIIAWTAALSVGSYVPNF